jgi:transposase
MNDDLLLYRASRIFRLETATAGDGFCGGIDEAGADRGQSTLSPDCLDDFIDESNPVRAIDAFVDALNLTELGFGGVEPAVTGRPSYHPSTLC